MRLPDSHLRGPAEQERRQVNVPVSRSPPLGLVFGLAYRRHSARLGEP